MLFVADDSTPTLSMGMMLLLLLMPIQSKWAKTHSQDSETALIWSFKFNLAAHQEIKIALKVLVKLYYDFAVSFPHLTSNGITNPGLIGFAINSLIGFGIFLGIYSCLG